MATKKWNEFSLKQKVDLLKNSDGKSSRQLVKAYGVGHTHAQNILKRKYLRITVAQAVNDNVSNFNNKLLNEAKFGLSCIVTSPQLRPQITGPNGDRNTGIVLYIIHLHNK